MPVTVKCPQCGAEKEIATSAFNRAMRREAPLYCGRRCAGLARRSGMTPEQRKAQRAEYDRKRRSEKAGEIKAQKAEYHRRTYCPEKARIERQKKMARHVEYCRRPEYRAWKQKFDREYRARKHYGDFAECFLIVQDLRNECLSQASDYEIRLQNGCLNKTRKRKRDYVRLNSRKSEIGPVGNAQ